MQCVECYIVGNISYVALKCT